MSDDDLLDEYGLRGTAAVPDAEPTAYDVLGELLQARAATRRTSISSPRARDWDLSFGPVDGQPGQVMRIAHRPGCLFRGEKLMVTDTASPAGTGTRIVSVAVGNTVIPVDKLTLFALPFGGSVVLPDCGAADTIVLTVKFISTCRFNGALFGKAQI